MAHQKRLLITGATGFVGTNLLKMLAEQENYHIRAVFHNKQPTVFAPNIDWVWANLLDKTECLVLMRDIDWVCSFAGHLSTTAIMREKPLGPVTENTAINLNLLEAASNATIEKYLWLSSSTGYPASEEPLSEEDFFEDTPPEPYEAVGLNSRYIESIGRVYAAKTGSPNVFIALRPTSIYGPGDDFDFATCHALPAMVRRVVERQNPIEIWGTGEDGRDLIYVDDVCRAAMRALHRVERGAAFNAGSGKLHTINEIVDLLLTIDNYFDVKITHLTHKSKHIQKRAFNCSKIAEAIGFEPKFSLKDGLAETVQWYRELITPKSEIVENELENTDG